MKIISPRDLELRIGVLLSVQRALLGNVPPCLRAVTVDYSSEAKRILLRSYFDGVIAEDDLELMSTVWTEVGADHPGFRVDWEVIRCDVPLPIQVLRDWAFMRRE